MENEVFFIGFEAAGSLAGGHRSEVGTQLNSWGPAVGGGSLSCPLLQVGAWGTPLRGRGRGRVGSLRPAFRGVARFPARKSHEA